MFFSCIYFIFLFLHFLGSVVQLAPAPLGYASQMSQSQSNLTVTSNSVVDESSMQQK